MGDGRVDVGGELKGSWERARREAKHKAIVPLMAHDLHHACVSGRGIAGTKRHHSEAVLAIVRGKES